ncbi:DNA-methyltransferase [Streptomyces sp. NPDC056061]|uniref:DNA-methyltransferase n=1 Tax=Streptomyces sp. NPDC056061 TaxID=3345700 RepID=UPI0035D62152
MMLRRAYYSDDRVQLLTGDALEKISGLAAGSVQTIVTSPPYFGLRDYGHPGQYGQERTLADYVIRLTALFDEARRVLADDGTLWLNLGDAYGPRKQLMGVPWRVAFALQDSGWTLRNSIVWHKPNAMPSNVKDRMGSRHENIFLFSKGSRYFFDLDAVRVPYTGDRKLSRRVHKSANKANTARGVWGLDEAQASRGRNPGDVWSISTRPYPAAHFATFPVDIPERCIKASSRLGDTVLDPCSGSGTTGMAALGLGRRYIGIDIRSEYHELAMDRMALPVSSATHTEESTHGQDPTH